MNLLTLHKQYLIYKLYIFSAVDVTSIVMTQSFPPLNAVGNRVSLTCETDSANPAPQIEWRMGSEKIYNGETFSILWSDLPGLYNADYQTSTLSFIAMQPYSGYTFECSVLNRSLSDSSVLYLKCESNMHCLTTS